MTASKITATTILATRRAELSATNWRVSQSTTAKTPSFPCQRVANWPVPEVGSFGVRDHTNGASRSAEANAVASSAFGLRHKSGSATRPTTFRPTAKLIASPARTKRCCDNAQATVKNAAPTKTSKWPLSALSAERSGFAPIASATRMSPVTLATQPTVATRPPSARSFTVAMPPPRSRIATGTTADTRSRATCC